jgi:hypothetical protein
LRGQVSAGINLFIHIQRGVLRIAQVILGIGVIDAAGEGRFIAAAGPHALAFLPIIIAVPVSWQVGSTPLAAISELRRNCSATYLSLSLASGSRRICATCFWWKRAA